MSDPQPSTDSPTSEGGSPKAFWEAINEIHLNYGRSQADAARSCQQAQRTAYRDYLNATAALQEDMQKRCEEVYKNYTSGMQDAAAQQDAPQRMATAQREVADTMGKIYEDTYRRLEEAYRDYLNQQQENQKQAAQTYRDAQREFLQAKKNAWAQLDVDAVINAR